MENDVLNANKVLIPLSSRDFDPSEVAIPWQTLSNQGFSVEFTTVDGQRAYADPLMLSGEGLDPWGFIPLVKKIKLVGLTLRAEKPARAAFKMMEQDANFKNPRRFADLNVEDYAGLWLPGGHAKGMRPFLEDAVLQQFVADFFDATDSKGDHKPVAAVCHGVVLAARAISSKTGRSVLYGKKTTALTWKFEKTAWLLSKFFARFWEPNYYRTYCESNNDAPGYWSVQAEVTRALANDSDFLDVAKNAPHYFAKTSGLMRDKPDNEQPAWVVQDGHYLSGRWPGDVYTLTKRFIKQLQPTDKNES